MTPNVKNKAGPTRAHHFFYNIPCKQPCNLRRLDGKLPEKSYLPSRRLPAAVFIGIRAALCLRDGIFWTVSVAC